MSWCALNAITSVPLRETLREIRERQRWKERQRYRERERWGGGDDVKMEAENAVIQPRNSIHRIC